MATEAYQNRYVAFLDILGFTKLVQKSESDAATFDQLLGITRSLAETVKSLASEYGALVDNEDIVCTAVSDSIVISIPEPADRNRTAGLYTVAFGVIGLCRKLLLDLEVLTRGGIARGRLYHKDGILFGSSFIDAYKLEHDVAKVARIVVDPIVAHQWAQTFGNPRGLVALKEVIRQDHDGAFILDIFHFPERDSIDKGTADFFRRAGPILSELLADTSLDRRALSKIAWLAKEYNRASILTRLPFCRPVQIAPGLNHPDT
jgi:hypothetical protein